MSPAALANGARRLVRHGRVPIHARHVLDLLIGQVHAKTDTEFKVCSISATDLYRQFGVARYPTENEAEALVLAVGSYTTTAHVGRMIVSVRWIERAIYDKENGLFSFQLSEQLRPFLLDLKKNYTQLRVRDLLRLRSGYAHQLYAIIMRFAPLTYKTIHKLPLGDFLDALHVPADHKARNDWKELSRDILKPAYVEVASKTALFFTLKPVRQYGRARGPVEAIEISGIRYAPEVLPDMQEADDRKFRYSTATQRKLDKLNSTDGQDDETESERVQRLDENGDPWGTDRFADL